MFKKILEAARREFSGEAAKGYVADLTRYHRIQASPGFREAAKYCEERLKGFGIRAELLSFPADTRTAYWSQRMFQEWDATDATLRLIEPEKERRKLADYGEVKNSLIQRSAPFSGTAEVVLLEDGEEVAEYEGLDLKGKVVLTKGDVHRICDLAVARHDAVGIIYDGMREVPLVRHRMDLADGVQYTSFWWIGDEPKCFGFVLSPKEGDRLRTLLKKGETVKVEAEVKSSIYDGQMEVVSALVPGETDEEVLLIAHLCHPQPSANDNASGCGALLETARVLQKLIGDGELAKPKRSIRFLLVPEMTGTYAWLATNEDRIPKIVAGVNLDMVGENQDVCGSSLVLVGSPASNASFADDLLERVLEEVGGEASGFGGLGKFPLFRQASTTFSGGSDHYILTDPSVGIPCPMLNQWPDKFYHTSEDTLDKVDPKMLSRVGAAVLAYAYFLANAGGIEGTWLGLEMVSRFKGRMARIGQEGITKILSSEKSEERAAILDQLARRVDFWLEGQIRALSSVRRLADIEVRELEEEIKLLAKREIEQARAFLRRRVKVGSVKARRLDEWEERAAGLVPQRVHRGPISLRSYLPELSDEERETWRMVTQEKRDLHFNLLPAALYWADGKRNLLEIADLLEIEFETRDMELLVTYFELMGKLGLIKLKSQS